MNNEITYKATRLTKGQQDLSRSVTASLPECPKDERGRGSGNAAAIGRKTGNVTTRLTANTPARQVCSYVVDPEVGGKVLLLSEVHRTPQMSAMNICRRLKHSRKGETLVKVLAWGRGLH